MKIKLKNFRFFLFRLMLAGKLKFLLHLFAFTKEVDFNQRIKDMNIFRDIVDCVVFSEILKTREHPFFLDIGANLGEFGRRIALLTGKQVIFIEPNPSVYAKLVNNTKGFGSAVQTALSDRDGQLNFSYLPNHTGNGRLSDTRHDGEVSIVVPCTTLDKLLDKSHSFGTVDLCAIKIDVEGLEPQVLKGAKNAVQRFRPFICLELSAGINFSKIQQLLDDYKFFTVRVPGLEYESNKFKRILLIFYSFIMPYAYFKKFDDSQGGFYSGLICIPNESIERSLNAVKSLSAVDMFY